MIKPNNASFGNKFRAGHTMKEKVRTMVSKFRTVVTMCVGTHAWRRCACGTRDVLLTWED